MPFQNILLSAIAGLAASAVAVPLSLGITFGSGSNELPTLTLPYATYKAYSYDRTDDYYTFKNIRFAAPPVGNLRWAKPQPPLQESGVQDGSVGYQCHQATSDVLSFAYPLLSALEPVSEDCLFLDIQVPGKAVRGEAKNLPVVFWLFGGGYVLGSKSFFLYDGNPMLKSAGNNVIWVAPNYRLGAFGFLGGPTVEKSATPNAALHDQRAALQWVQDHITLLGGDKNTVTAMGESAGAGSIMHHLVGNRGKSHPLFHRAIIMSPGFEPMYSPATLEGRYQQFAKAAGCEGKGISCLRSKSSDVLQKANLAVATSAQYGTFGWGVAVDNQYIHDLPMLELKNGNYWKDMSVLIGHTSDEGLIFANPVIILNSQFDSLMKTNFPNASTAALNALEKQYPEPSLLGPYIIQFARLSQMIGDWIINCNARALAKAYQGKAWQYVFSVPPGVHGLDLIFAFWRTDLNIGRIFQIDIDINFITEKNYATGFISYLSSFARSGNPNTYRQSGSIPPTITFPEASVGDKVRVLDVGLTGFSSRLDEDSEASRCDYWEAGAWTGR